MTTSASTQPITQPRKGEVISDYEVQFFRQRLKDRVHNLILTELKKHNVSQSELAARLGKQKAVISRLVGASGNWTLDTVSDLLLAIGGYELALDVTNPFDAPPRRKKKHSPEPKQTQQSSRRQTSTTQTHVEPVPRVKQAVEA